MNQAILIGLLRTRCWAGSNCISNIGYRTSSNCTSKSGSWKWSGKYSVCNSKHAKFSGSVSGSKSKYFRSCSNGKL
jgi:hypothetical protein